MGDAQRSPSFILALDKSHKTDFSTSPSHVQQCFRYQIKTGTAEGCD